MVIDDLLKCHYNNREECQMFVALYGLSSIFAAIVTLIRNG